MKTLGLRFTSCVARGILGVCILTIGSFAPALSSPTLGDLTGHVASPRSLHLFVSFDAPSGRCSAGCGISYRTALSDREIEQVFPA